MHGSCGALPNILSSMGKYPGRIGFGHEFYIEVNIMEKIKNGDPVLYKNQKGTIYGKPRENKYKGLLYTVKIGDDYIKASANELTPQPDDSPGKSFQLFNEQESR